MTPPSSPVIAHPRATVAARIANCGKTAIQDTCRTIGRFAVNFARLFERSDQERVRRLLFVYIDRATDRPMTSSISSDTHLVVSRSVAIPLTEFDVEFVRS